MEEVTLKSIIQACQFDELDDTERRLVQMAIDSTQHSYAPYSHFHVGAALLLSNGVMLPGCNQENAAFPAGLCAERSAIFAAGAQYPKESVEMLAIAARDTHGELTTNPVSPCGTCRQVMIETETRFQKPIRILLYGKDKVYKIDGIKQLMPLSFTEF
jgi:cytidine deaminase